LTSHQEATRLGETHTDLRIPEEILEKLKAAGGDTAQEELGLKICAEIASTLKDMEGVRGIHILSGGRERLIADLCATAGL
jgi:5,10-methylenetetrahydrofolate reductase